MQELLFNLAVPTRVGFQNPFWAEKMALCSIGKVYLGSRRRVYFARKSKMFLSKEPPKKKDEDDDEEDQAESDQPLARLLPREFDDLGLMGLGLGFLPLGEETVFH
jgi:hypothetical protein